MLLFENHSFIFCFGCTASSLPPGLSLVQQVWAALHYSVEASSGGFSSCRMWAQGCVGSVAVVHGLSCPLGTWNLLGPGAEPVSPALAGQLLTTGPPVKPPELVFSTSYPFIPCSPLPRRCWTFPLLRPAKPLSPLLQPPPNFSALLISSKTPVPTLLHWIRISNH